MLPLVSDQDVKIDLRFYNKTIETRAFQIETRHICDPAFQIETLLADARYELQDKTTANFGENEFPS